MSQQQQMEAVANSLGEVIEILATMLKEFQDQQALIMASNAKKAANEQMVQKLTEDLAKLAADILETQQSIAELVRMRQEERAQFEAAMADVTKTIKAVTKATEILEGHYAADAASLSEIKTRVQLALATYGLQTKTATPQNVQALSALLQQGAGAHEPDYLAI